MTVNLKLYAWIVKGTQRTAILKVMDKPRTVTEVCKKSKYYNKRISLNNCSDILRSFVRHGVAICLNKEEKVGRLYQLTKAAEEIRIELLKE